MEKGRKAVDRQATFDTDARNKNKNLTLPVIDSKDDKSTLNSNSKESKGKGKIDSNANIHYKSSVPTNSKLEAKSRNSEVKKSTEKLDIQKKDNSSVKTIPKHNNSKQSTNDNTKSGPQTVKPDAKVDKNSNSVVKTVSPPKKVIDNKTSIDSPRNNPGTKSTSLSKAIEVKQSKKETEDRQEKQKQPDRVYSKSTVEGPKKQINSKQSDHVPSKSVNQVNQNNKTREIDHVSRNTEKKPTPNKASVLNTLNLKRSKSPARPGQTGVEKQQTNTDTKQNQSKASDLSNKVSKQSDVRTNKVDNPASKASVLNTTNRKRSVSPVKRVASPTRVVKETKDKTPPNLTPRKSKESKDSKSDSASTVNNPSPLKIEQLGTPRKGDTSKSPTRTTNNLPRNNAPNETSLRSNNHVHSDERSPNLLIPDDSPRSTDSQNHSNKSNLNAYRSQPTKQETSKNVTIDSSLSQTLSENQNPTYVVSPSVAKIEARSTGPHRVSRPGRLSPTTEDFEISTVHSKSVQDNSKMAGRESFEQVYAERNTLLKAEYTFRKRIKQLEEEANGFLKAIEDLTAENKVLREHECGETSAEGRGDTINSEQLSRLVSENDRFAEKVKHLEKELQKQKEESDNSSEVRELKEQMVKLQSENQKANSENGRLKEKNGDMSEEIRRLKFENKNLEAGVKTDSEKLNGISMDQQQMSKQLKEYKAKAKDLERKVDALEFENKGLSESLAQKKHELGEIMGVMKDENKFDDEIKDLKNQVTKLSKEKRDIELAKNREKRLVSEQLSETKAALEKLTGEYDEMKIKHDYMEKESKKLKSEITPMKKQIEEYKKEIERLKEENERLRLELEQTNEKYNKLFGETESANKDLIEAKTELETFNKELQSIVTDKESQISKLINQLDSMREERDGEKKVLREEREKLTKEIDRVEQLQSSNRRLEADVKHYVEKIDEYKLKEKQQELKIEDKNFQISNLEQQVFEMNMKMDNYSKRMSDMDREKREIERDKREWDVKKDKIDDIESSNRRLLEENKRLRNQLEMATYVGTDVRSQKQPTAERSQSDKGIVEAWVHDKVSTANQTALYVTKERDKKRVHIVQPNVQKKRVPFSKSNPVKPKQDSRKKEETRAKSPSRSMEDLRKAALGPLTPESEHSLPELHTSGNLAFGYGNFGGYREIHKNRIRAAHKRVY